MHHLPRAFLGQGREERHPVRRRVLAPEPRREDPGARSPSSTPREEAAGQGLTGSRDNDPREDPRHRTRPSRRRSSPTPTSRSSSRRRTSGSRSRTGIRERHIVAEGEHFSDLCTRAGERALKRAHVKPEDVDMILVGTISADMPFPATSCLVQHNLGATRAAASDCRRGVRRLPLRAPPRRRPHPGREGQNVLVIGGEILSRYVDWTDRNTCVLFGDGAGAVAAPGDAGRPRHPRQHDEVQRRVPRLHLHAGRRLGPTRQRSEVDRGAAARSSR